MPLDDGTRTLQWFEALGNHLMQYLAYMDTLPPDSDESDDGMTGNPWAASIAAKRAESAELTECAEPPRKRRRVIKGLDSRQACVECTLFAREQARATGRDAWPPAANLGDSMARLATAPGEASAAGEESVEDRSPWTKGFAHDCPSDVGDSRVPDDWLAIMDM